MSENVIIFFKVFFSEFFLFICILLTDALSKKQLIVCVVHAAHSRESVMNRICAGGVQVVITTNAHIHFLNSLAMV